MKEVQKRLFNIWEKSEVKIFTREIDDASDLFNKCNDDGTRMYQGYVVIYVDGSCSANGSIDKESTGDIRVYFGHGCKYNKSERMPVLY